MQTKIETAKRGKILYLSAGAAVLLGAAISLYMLLMTWNPAILLANAAVHGPKETGRFSISASAAASGDTNLFEGLQNFGVDTATMMKTINSLSLDGNGCYDTTHNVVYFEKATGSFSGVTASGPVLMTEDKLYLSLTGLADVPLTVAPQELNLSRFLLDTGTAHPKEAERLRLAVASVLAEFIRKNPKVLTNSDEFQKEHLSSVDLSLSIAQADEITGGFLQKIQNDPGLMQAAMALYNAGQKVPLDESAFRKLLSDAADWLKGVQAAFNNDKVSDSLDIIISLGMRGSDVRAISVKAVSKLLNKTNNTNGFATIQLALKLDEPAKDDIALLNNAAVGKLPDAFQGSASLTGRLNALSLPRTADFRTSFSVGTSGGDPAFLLDSLDTATPPGVWKSYFAGTYLTATGAYDLDRKLIYADTLLGKLTDADLSGKLLLSGGNLFVSIPKYVTVPFYITQNDLKSALGWQSVGSQDSGQQAKEQKLMQLLSDVTLTYLKSHGSLLQLSGRQTDNELSLSATFTSDQLSELSASFVQRIASDAAMKKMLFDVINSHLSEIGKQMTAADFDNLLNHLPSDLKTLPKQLGSTAIDHALSLQLQLAVKNLQLSGISLIVNDSIFNKVNGEKGTVFLRLQTQFEPLSKEMSDALAALQSGKMGAFTGAKDVQNITNNEAAVFLSTFG